MRTLICSESQRVYRLSASLSSSAIACATAAPCLACGAGKSDAMPGESAAKWQCPCAENTSRASRARPCASRGRSSAAGPRTAQAPTAKGSRPGTRDSGPRLITPQRHKVPPEPASRCWPPPKKYIAKGSPERETISYKLSGPRPKSGQIIRNHTLFLPV